MLTYIKVLDPVRTSLPLYLNPESPFCLPIMSHNATSHNVVLKVTVPKRTGRKRKRGSNGPWQGDVEIPDSKLEAGRDQPRVCSIARLDEPKVLRRKLEDNVGKYHVEAAGLIKHTHRFRALADFFWNMDKSSFTQRYVQQVLPGDGMLYRIIGFSCFRHYFRPLTSPVVDQLKNFSFEPGTDRGPNVDIIPPPLFTHMGLPFNYFYAQNPYVRETEDGGTINKTAVKQIGHFIGAEDPAPEGPQHPPDMTNIRTVEVLSQLEDAFQYRPVWTRRSLLGHLHGKLRNWNELKKYLNYAAYQFKGGPWRDSVIPYGTDPRTDPKYRIYQTLMFKLSKHKRPRDNPSWQSLRRAQTVMPKSTADDVPGTHIFDGETYSTDGKVWQVCDITDPLLKELLDNASIRPECDVNSGWYHGGLWAKVKAIMKTKLVAIQFGRTLTKEDFAPTLEMGDRTPTRSTSTSTTFHMPLPNLNLTDAELATLRGREPAKKKSSAKNIWVRDPGRSPGPGTSEQSPTPAVGSSIVGDDRMESDNDEDEVDFDSDGDDADEGSDNEIYPAHATYHERGNDDDDEDDDMGMSRVTYPELD